MEKLRVPEDSACLVLNSRNIKNLRFANQLPALERLYISGNERLLLSFITQLPQLRLLNADFCGLQDVSVLYKLEFLEVLVARGNRIRQVSEMRRLVFLDLSLNYTSLELRNVPELRRFVFQRCEVSAAGAIQDGLFGRYGRQRMRYLSGSTAISGVTVTLSGSCINFEGGVAVGSGPQAVVTIFRLVSGCELRCEGQRMGSLGEMRRLCMDGGETLFCRLGRIESADNLDYKPHAGFSAASGNTDAYPVYEHQIAAEELIMLPAQRSELMRSARSYSIVAIECTHACWVAVYCAKQRRFLPDLSCLDSRKVEIEVEIELAEPSSVHIGEEAGVAGINLKNATPNEAALHDPAALETPTSNQQTCSAQSARLAKSVSQLPYYFSKDVPACGATISIAKAAAHFRVSSVRYFISSQTKQQVLYGIAELLQQLGRAQDADLRQVFIYSVLNSHGRVFYRSGAHVFFLALHDALGRISDAPAFVYCVCVGEGKEVALPAGCAGKLLIAELELSGQKYSICCLRSIVEAENGVRAADGANIAACPPQPQPVAVFSHAPPREDQCVLFAFEKTARAEGKFIRFSFMPRTTQRATPRVLLFHEYDTAQYNKGQNTAAVGFLLIYQLQVELVGEQTWQCAYKVQFRDAGKRLVVKIAFSQDFSQVFCISGQIDWLPRVLDCECQVLGPSGLEPARVFVQKDKLCLTFSGIALSAANVDVYACTLDVLLAYDADEGLAFDGVAFKTLARAYYCTVLDSAGFSSSFRMYLVNSFLSLDLQRFAAVFLRNQAFLLAFEDAAAAVLAVNLLYGFAGMAGARQPFSPTNNELKQQPAWKPPVRLPESAGRLSMTVGSSLDGLRDFDFLLLKRGTAEQRILQIPAGASGVPSEWCGWAVFGLKQAGVEYVVHYIAGRVGKSARVDALCEPESAKSLRSLDECEIYGEKCRLRLDGEQLSVRAESRALQDYFDAEIISQFSVLRGRADGELIFCCGGFSFLCTAGREFAAHWACREASGKSGIE